MTPAQRIEAYIKLRDFKKKSDEDYRVAMKRVYEGMERLENELLADLQTVGADSLSCPRGTVYRITELSATVEDRDVFLAHVKSQDEWEALDVRANKTFVREILEKGGDVPGVKISQYAKIGVRRS